MLDYKDFRQNYVLSFLCFCNSHQGGTETLGLKNGLSNGAGEVLLLYLRKIFCPNDELWCFLVFLWVVFMSYG